MKKLIPVFYICSAIAFIHSFVYLIISPVYKMRLDTWILGEYMAYLFIFFLGLVVYIFGVFFRNKKIFAIISILISVVIFSFIFSFTYYEREVVSPQFYNSLYPEDNEYFGVWNAALWLDQNVPDAKVAYSGFHFHYPLFGRNFSRSVDYININDCSDCRYVDYKNSLDSIRRDPSYDFWVGNLEKANKNYIVVDSTIMPVVENYELKWMQENPEKFELVRAYGSTFIYRVIFS